MLNEAELSEFYSNALGIELCFAVCTEDLELAHLSPGEKSRLDEMKHERRRSSWLRGRNALKRLQLSRLTPTHSMPAAQGAPLAENDSSLSRIDTSQMQIPNPTYSLSHTESVAVAVARMDSASGIGIDIEGRRDVRSAMKKFYLSLPEQNQIQADTNETLLRLWTIKESLFKSDMRNKDKTLLKYNLDDAAAALGFATTVCDGVSWRFKYASKKFADFWLSVSIAI